MIKITFLQEIKSILDLENIPITYREDSIVFISNWSNIFIHEADPHCWNTGKKILSLQISKIKFMNFLGLFVAGITLSLLIGTILLSVAIFIFVKHLIR